MAKVSGNSAPRVALVTGAARRVGAVIARHLHAAGWDLALHARTSRAELAALAAALEGERANSTVQLFADLADVDALPGLVQSAVARFGHLDALVNNAATYFPTPVAAATPAQWATLFGTNARAPYFLAQAAAPHLAAARGAIVNIVDIHADRPPEGYSVYAMSKAALAAMTRALARDLAPEVRVNGVAPGVVLWPESGKPAAERDAVLARTPLARAGTPDDVASAVLWLLDGAAYVTGQIIAVDGGRSIVG